MKRIVFTFGTLYEDDIIKALLGEIPVNFDAYLEGHDIYQGVFMQIPLAVQERLAPRVDNQTFTFLFAKSGQPQSRVGGRAYEITLEQELILDHWEIYPDWYRKKAVTICAADGAKHEAFMYTVDYEGQKLAKFTRVTNDLAGVIENAKSARARVFKKFPEAFNKQPISGR